MEDSAIYNKQPATGLQTTPSALIGGGVIGIDFGATQLRAAIVTEHGLGKIISKPTPNQGTADDVWQAISTLIQSVIDSNEGHMPAAVCVGVPSVVDTTTGTVFNVQHIPACKELPLGKLISESFGALTLVNNDANAFALGEYYFGEGAKRPNTEINGNAKQLDDIAELNYNKESVQPRVKKYTSANSAIPAKSSTSLNPAEDLSTAPVRTVQNSSLVGLTIGTGLGAGLILDGKLYSGPNCGAGEIGCLPYLDANLERYVSGSFFHKDGVNGKEYYQKALSGDQKALELYREFGHHLGQAIKITMYTYDPDWIVLGGSVSKAFNFFEEEMFSTMQDFDYPGILDKVKIFPSKLEHSAILGAASLYFDFVKHSSF